MYNNRLEIEINIRIRFRLIFFYDFHNKITRIIYFVILNIQIFMQLMILITHMRVYFF